MNIRMRRPASIRRWLVRAGIALAALFVVIQLIPYGRSHTNPATTKEPSWDSSQTRALFMASCGDCHSNQTSWPWYTNVAPVSWLTQRDVDGGRSALNVSNWDQPQDVSAQEIAESIQGGSMPPWFYTPLHSRASLSKAQQQRLIQGLGRTFAASPPLGGG
jgi:mono/diheme cytochrome c family protein